MQNLKRPLLLLLILICSFCVIYSGGHSVAPLLLYEYMGLASIFQKLEDKELLNTLILIWVVIICKLLMLFSLKNQTKRWSGFLALVCIFIMGICIVTMGFPFENRLDSNFVTVLPYLISSTIFIFLYFSDLKKDKLTKNI
jgi:ABC-type transport system involved in cytochrome c biogenesis permease subunit